MKCIFCGSKIINAPSSSSQYTCKGAWEHSIIGYKCKNGHHYNCEGEDMNYFKYPFENYRKEYKKTFTYAWRQLGKKLRYLLKLTIKKCLGGRI